MPAFRSLEETEMPQLKAHCQELTKAGRSSSCRRFINNLSQLLNSLSLWASSDGASQNLSADQREREADDLKKLEEVSHPLSCQCALRTRYLSSVGQT